MSVKSTNKLADHMVYYGGLLTIIFYLCFLIIAWILFPNPASPLDHWLSDLGRYEVPIDGNPVWRFIDGSYKLYSELGINSIPNLGAIFYNIGCIFTGIMMMVFFIGLMKIENSEIKRIKIITNIFTLLGIIGGIFLILIGIFAEDGIFLIVNEQLAYPVHHTATLIFFLILLIIKGVAGYWALKLNLNRFITIFSWLIIIFDLIVVFTGNNYALIEWLSVLTSLALVGIIALGIRVKFLRL
ncbi:MAG: DUF998 domain-containing protein [Candidatus Lokiarchaeota archaeon]|nr:DUF998 domain-containing protein [Candidatus Lokiarchaeota archaeon]MBD3199495.1 DUF998 domain-containing protein [Candidatus Lokiarchaeota archaeon]